MLLDEACTIVIVILVWYVKVFAAETRGVGRVVRHLGPRVADSSGGERSQV